MDITGNLLKNTIEELKGLNFLKKLVISQNELNELWDVPIQLETLVVSNNSLKSVGKNIGKLINLKVLDISSNQINDCNGFQGLSKLQILNASNNEIASLDYFDNLTSLKECNLKFNRISLWSPSNALCKLDSLEILLLEGNPILS